MLNLQQQNALEKCVKAYTDGQRIFGLIGGGGVGKTYTSQHIIKACSQATIGQFKCMLLAPTNSALKSLRASFKDVDKSELEFRTLHAALKKQPDIDDYGKIKFGGESDSKTFQDVNMIFVDEASMIQKELVTELIDIAKELKCFVLVCGDKYQHYPIGELSSTLIDLVKKDHVELTQIMRQTGSILAEPIQLCRDAVKKKEKSFDPRWTFNETQTEIFEEKTIGYYVPENNTLRQMWRAYNKAYEIKNFNFCKIIGHRNKIVDEKNIELRACLWGVDAPEYVPGELVLIKKPVMRDVPNPATAKYIQVTMLHTGSEVLVQKAEKEETTFLGELDSKTNKHKEYSFTQWELLVREIGMEFDVKIVVLSNDSLENYKILLEKYKVKAKKKVKEAREKNQTTKGMWSDYYKLLNFFDSVKYGYACTSVYVQGKSYNSVFVLADDIASLPNEDSVNRAFYVALSRAVEKIIIC